jgi:hypothetical protein
MDERKKPEQDPGPAPALRRPDDEVEDIEVPPEDSEDVRGGSHDAGCFVSYVKL